ncbi:MAG: hypothetical protein ACPIOQ_13490, partial [Promethearchaeia archaeon]
MARGRYERGILAGRELVRVAKACFGRSAGGAGGYLHHAAVRRAAGAMQAWLRAATRRRAWMD